MTATQSECIVWKCKLQISIASLTVTSAPFTHDLLVSCIKGLEYFLNFFEPFPMICSKLWPLSFKRLPLLYFHQFLSQSWVFRMDGKTLHQDSSSQIVLLQSNKRFRATLKGPYERLRLGIHRFKGIGNCFIIIEPLVVTVSNVAEN